MKFYTYSLNKYLKAFLWSLCIGYPHFQFVQASPGDLIGNPYQFTLEGEVVPSATIQLQGADAEGQVFNFNGALSASNRELDIPLRVTCQEECRVQIASYNGLKLRHIHYPTVPSTIDYKLYRDSQMVASKLGSGEFVTVSGLIPPGGTFNAQIRLLLDAAQVKSAAAGTHTDQFTVRLSSPSSGN